MPTPQSAHTSAPFAACRGLSCYGKKKYPPSERSHAHTHNHTLTHLHIIGYLSLIVKRFVSHVNGIVPSLSGDVIMTNCSFLSRTDSVRKLRAHVMNRNELADILRLMADKEIRIRTDVREIELLENDLLQKK